jgi:hypothetical protein
MLKGGAADTASMGSPEGQRYAIAFDRSDGWAPLALSFLSTERAAFGLGGYARTGRIRNERRAR